MAGPRWGAYGPSPSSSSGVPNPAGMDRWTRTTLEMAKDSRGVYQLERMINHPPPAKLPAVVPLVGKVGAKFFPISRALQWGWDIGELVADWYWNLNKPGSSPSGFPVYQGYLRDKADTEMADGCDSYPATTWNYGPHLSSSTWGCTDFWEDPPDPLPLVDPLTQPVYFGLSHYYEIDPSVYGLPSTYTRKRDSFTRYVRFSTASGTGTRTDVAPGPEAFPPPAPHGWPDPMPRSREGTETRFNETPFPLQWANQSPSPRVEWETQTGPRGLRQETRIGNPRVATRDRSKKFILAVAGGAVKFAANGITEANDFIDCMWKQLKPARRLKAIRDYGLVKPKDRTLAEERPGESGELIGSKRRKTPGNDPTGGTGVPLGRKIQDLVNHGDDLYREWSTQGGPVMSGWTRAFNCAVENQIEDYLLGQVGSKTAEANRALGDMFGGRGRANIGLGPTF